jgi:hypothetical protein
VIDVPDADLNPFCERASVRMEKPVSLVVLDHIELVHVRLAMRAGLDLKSFFFDSIASLGVAEQSDIADNLTDLCKLDRSLDWEPGISIVDVASFN